MNKKYCYIGAGVLAVAALAGVAYYYREEIGSTALMAWVLANNEFRL